MGGCDRNVNQCGGDTAQAMCCQRISVTELVRAKSRRFRDHAHDLENLADELERFSFSKESDEILFTALANMQIA
jgi:hypothetical protein